MKNYLGMIAVGDTTEKLLVIDPALPAVVLSATHDQTLLNTVFGQMASDFSVTYGGGVTYADPVQMLVGFSPIGEAVFVVSLSATNFSDPSYSVGIRVVATKTTTRVISSYDDVVTKFPSNPNALPATFLGFNNETVYMGGYDSASGTPATPYKIYEMLPTGVVVSPAPVNAVGAAILPYLVSNGTTDYLAFGVADASEFNGTLLKKVGASWVQQATSDGATANYPLSQVVSMAVSGGVAVSYATGLSDDPLRYPQGRDSETAFGLQGVVLTNLSEGTTDNLQAMMDAALGEAAGILFDYASFCITDPLPAIAFWQDKVNADEIV